jgi:hypothetical protein
VLRVSREQGLLLPARRVLLTGLTAWSSSSWLRSLSVKAIRIRVARGVFAEGAPAFPGSFLSEGSHVQVAVRDTDLISTVNVAPAGVLSSARPPPALLLPRPQVLDQFVLEALKRARRARGASRPATSPRPSARRAA